MEACSSEADEIDSSPKNATERKTILEKILFIIETKYLVTSSGSSSGAEKPLDFQPLKERIQSGKYSGLIEFQNDIKNLLGSEISKYKPFNTSTMEIRDGLLGVLNLAISLIRSRKNTRVNPPHTQNNFEGYLITKGEENSGSREYALVRRSPDGIPYFSSSFAFIDSKVPSMSLKGIGRTPLLPSLSLRKDEIDTVGNLSPETRVIQRNLKRKIPSFRIVGVVRTMDNPDLQTRFSGIYTGIDTVSVRETTGGIAVMETQKELEKLKTSPYMDINSLTIESLYKQIFKGGDGCLDLSDMSLELLDRMLTENSRILLLLETFQNHRFSINDHGISSVEKTIVLLLVNRLKALVKTIPPKLLVHTSSIRNLVKDIRLLDSAYMGTITPSSQIRRVNNQCTAAQPEAQSIKYTNSYINMQRDAGSTSAHCNHPYKNR